MVNYYEVRNVTGGRQRDRKSTMHVSDEDL